MPRHPRIEYPGAHYFITSKAVAGLRPWQTRQSIEGLLVLLGQLSRRVGWSILAYAVLPSRYQLVIHTPEANLSAGMKWFQSALSQQIRGETDHIGPALEGRYKAAPVDAAQNHGVLLEECADYLHLLPEKEDLLEPWEPLDATTRTSLPFYSGRSTDCPPWLDPVPVFESAGLPLSFTGRAKYIRKLEQRVRTWSTEAGRLEEKAREARFYRGWYIGNREFGKQLLERLSRRSAEVHSSSERQDPDSVSRVSEEDRARNLLRQRLAELGLNLEDLQQRAKSDPLKIALAAELRENAMISNRWLSDTLQMGHPSRVSRYTRGELSPALAGKVREIQQNLGV